MTEFAYNSSINRTTCLSLFEVVTDFKPRQPIDLVHMAHHHSRVSDSASTFASHLHALHEEIREKIMKNNADYKAYADVHRRLRVFNVGYCDGSPETRMISSGNRQEIARAKHMTFSTQEDQFKCLCDGPPTRF